jgi:hypothetical protein
VLDFLAFHKQALSWVKKSGKCEWTEDMLSRVHQKHIAQGNLQQEIESRNVYYAYTRMDKPKLIVYLEEKVLDDESKVTGLTKEVQKLSWREFQRIWAENRPPNADVEQAMQKSLRHESESIRKARCKSIFTAYLDFIAKECPNEVLRVTCQEKWSDFSMFPGLDRSRAEVITGDILSLVGTKCYLSMALDEVYCRQFVEDQAHIAQQQLLDKENELIEFFVIPHSAVTEFLISEGEDGPVSL